MQYADPRKYTFSALEIRGEGGGYKKGDWGQGAKKVYGRPNLLNSGEKDLIKMNSCFQQ